MKNSAITQYFFGSLILLTIAYPTYAETIAITGAHIFDATGGAPIDDGTLIIEDTRIVAVGEGASITVPKDAHIIEADGNWLLPGLVDLHGHPLFYLAGPREFADDSLAALRGAAVLRQALDSGITLIRDVASPKNIAIGLKLAIERSYLVGPRYVVSNRIVGATGSHASEFILMQNPSDWVMESDSPGEWRKHIRENVKLGADFIKVTPPFTAEEIEMAAIEAHIQGVRLAVHAGGYGDRESMQLMGVEFAVAAGADTIEHLYPMKNEDKVIRMMRDQDTIVVPTFGFFQRNYWDKLSPAEMPSDEARSDYERRFRKLHKAGVKMGIGTDVGGAAQNQLAEFYVQELEIFLEWGYSAEEVLQAATRIGAEAVGLGGELGTLEPGKRADLIVVQGNPLEDVALVTRPDVVIKDGIIVRDFR